MNSMKFIRKNPLVLVILFLLLFCFADSVAAEGAAGTTDKWQYELTIYGWLPSIDGTLKYNVPPDSGGNVSVDASDILENLNFVFMGVLEARKNKLSFGFDLIYMDISNSTSTKINLGPGPGPGAPLSVYAGLGLESWVITGIVGYDLVQTDKARMAVIGGVRYLDLSADVDISVYGTLDDLPPAHLSGSKDFWDGIIGIKGVFMLNEKWYIPYYADIGTGESKLTWQLYAAIGYQFHWGDIKLGYRYLEYDQDDDKLLEDLKLYGPLLGIGFRF